MTEVQIADRTRDGHRVLSIFGDLDPAAVAKVRRTLQKALLDSPVPVICDLTGVRSFATATLTVFSGVLATVGGWPDASLALAAPTAPLREALGIAGVTSRVPVFDAVESAVASPPSAWRPELLVRTRPLSFSGLAAAEARTEATAF